MGKNSCRNNGTNNKKKEEEDRGDNHYHHYAAADETLSPASSSSASLTPYSFKVSNTHQFAVLLGLLNIILTSIVIRFHSCYFPSLLSPHKKPQPIILAGPHTTTTTEKQHLHKTKSFQDAVAYGPLGLRGISHICINVPDVDKAAEFYHRVLGYEIMDAGEKWGKFDLRNLDSQEFCKSAGFMDGKCRLDCLWMKHPTININLELFHYYEPNVVNRLEQENWLSNTQDIGGFKHISYAVQDAQKAFEFLKTQEGVRFITDDPDYHPVKMEPFPFKFFYWIDPYGVQWECEEGDEIVTHQISGVTRNVDKYIEFKEKKM
jgi:catechol 2,3-dioxygenase-like lactoylglutathione lyase family enzyme